MEKVLKKVYNCSRPKYSTYQFISMLNVGLVLDGIKKGALEKLDSKCVLFLNSQGYFAQPYPLIKGLTFISLKDPEFGSNVTHTEIGKHLSYFTPLNIFADHPNKKFVCLTITFRKNKGKTHEQDILNQVVIGKTNRQILRYLNPFIKHLYKLPLIYTYKILTITPTITKVS